MCAGCGAVLPATLPAGVPRGQIGPRALATIGTLGTKYQMPQLKIRDLLAQEARKVPPALPPQASTGEPELPPGAMPTPA